MRRLLYIFLSLIPLFAYTQNGTKESIASLKNLSIQPIIGLQLWSSYSFGTKIYQKENGRYEAVDNRLNVMLRRGRLGVKGQIDKNISFNVTAALDLVGRDVLAATEGGSNNGASPKFRLWNAYIQWKVKSGSEVLHIVAGYFPPQIGRESISSALRSTSLEKSWSQNYLRRHLTGIGPGRAVGLNLGGLLLNKAGQSGLGYNFGIFNPVFESYGGNSIGNKYAPLLVGRIVAYIGEPESKHYSIGHKTNYLGKRKGLSIGIAGARQGETALFLKNYALGGDFLFNWNKWNFDGEWTYLIRRGERLFDDDLLRQFSASTNTGYLRLSYNISLKNQLILEPMMMWMQFNGGMTANEQQNAEAVGSSAGKDQSIDIGLNLYVNPHTKLSLHYTLRQGQAGASGAGASINNYFFQSGVGAIQKGDWLGLGLVMSL